MKKTASCVYSVWKRWRPTYTQNEKDHVLRILSIQRTNRAHTLLAQSKTFLSQACLLTKYIQFIAKTWKSMTSEISCQCTFKCRIVSTFPYPLSHFLIMHMWKHLISEFFGGPFGRKGVDKNKIYSKKITAEPVIKLINPVLFLFFKFSCDIRIRTVPMANL